DPRARERLRAVLISLAAGSVILVAKFAAWLVTGSTVVLADALESIVNVVAATFALGGIVFASRPADENHPYGHGKMEFFTAAFEGGLVAFAAITILYEGVRALIEGVTVREPETGLWILAAAGAANLALGAYLVRAGGRTHSPALVADGKHVLSDVITSAGSMAGLGLAWWTGKAWIDPAAAVVLGAVLAVAGFRLVRHAAGGLLDEEDPALLEALAAAIAETRVDGAIEVHRARAIRVGPTVHVDAHVVVPEFWTVEQAHAAGLELERTVLERWGREGEIALHLDPCRRAYCAACPLADCPVRAAPFAARPPVTRASIVGPPSAPGGE
ncbi:MAG TPA: cation diffusion facilitator family transporter, partial [Planctomycetota bacterium]|nr:cation diffusion facilitator family transporter [Planctomycetota bacterium]